MTSIKKVKGTAASMPVGVAMGVLTSIIVTFSLAALLTWLAFGGRIEENILGYLVIGVLLIASVLGSLLSAGKVKRRRILVCCLTGLIYYLILLGSTAVFFGGNYRGVGVSGFVVFIGVLTSGLLGLNNDGHRDKRFRKYRTC